MICNYDESLVILRDFFVFVERTENKVCYLCLQSPNILDVKRPIGLTFQQTATKQTRLVPFSQARFPAPLLYRSITLNTK